MLEFDGSVPSSVSVYVPLATSVDVELELELLPHPSENPRTSSTINELSRGESLFLLARTPRSIIPAIAILAGNILREKGFAMGFAATARRGAKNRTAPFRWLEPVELQSDSEVEIVRVVVVVLLAVTLTSPELFPML